MRLFKVTCRGMTHSVGSDVKHGVAYVVAEDASEAYRTLRKHLDKKDIGFTKDREMEKVELIAEETDYPDCGIRLFAPEV